MRLSLARSKLTRAPLLQVPLTPVRLRFIPVSCLTAPKSQSFLAIGQCKPPVTANFLFPYGGVRNFSSSNWWEVDTSKEVKPKTKRQVPWLAKKKKTANVDEGDVMKTTDNVDGEDVMKTTGNVDGEDVMKITGNVGEVDVKETTGNVDEGDVKKTTGKRKSSDRKSSDRKPKEKGVAFPPPVIGGGGAARNMKDLGFNEWPASSESLEICRAFLKDAAESPHAVLLVPDHEIDGISAGTTISLTLQLLGKPLDEIKVHFGRRDQDEIRRVCRKHRVGHVIVFNKEGIIFQKPLAIDNQPSTLFPQKTTTLTSQFHPPIAPTSFLAYVLCAPLHHIAPAATTFPALLGTLGSLPQSNETMDMLGTPPYTLYMDTQAALKHLKITRMKDLISMVGTAHRQPFIEGLDVTQAVWEILQFDPHSDQAEWPIPRKVLSGTWGSANTQQAVARLTSLQELCKAEINKCKRIPPKFSHDQRLALIEINSPWQIHPLLVNRWTSMGAREPKLLAVVCANTGYVSGKVTFCVRRTYLGDQQDVDVTSLLEGYVDNMLPVLREGMGDDWIKGHKKAAGGALEKMKWDVFKEEGIKIVDKTRTAQTVDDIPVEIGDMPDLGRQSIMVNDFGFVPETNSESRVGAN